MFNHFKLKSTASLIVLAFVFRLLFSNVCVFAAPETTQVKKQVHTYAWLLKRRNIEEVSGSVSEKYSAVEICEERPDN